MVIQFHVPRWVARSILALTFVLVACSGGPDRPNRGPGSSLQYPSAAETRACYAALDSAGVRYERLPDRKGPGVCGYTNALRVVEYGIPTTNLTALSCPLASRFTAWVRNGVAPAAQIALGSPVVRVETMGSYACRNQIGNGSGQISQHASANALDIAGFVLADGRRITVKAHWKNGGAEGRFLGLIHQSACKRFSTVLSPEYNSAHADHFHFDLGGRGHYCR